MTSAHEASPRRSPARRLLALALVAAAGATLACRSTPRERAVLPVLEAGDTDAALGYESPPTLRASELLDPEQLRGPHHRVREEVRTDGFLHLYRVRSPFGDLEVAGDTMLRARLDEISAIAALHEASRTREFAAAVRKGLQSPFVAAWNLVTDPVDSLLGIPSRAWESVRRTAELARGERGELEDRALREFIGFERRKRAIAHRVGVDPYSSNPILQRELNRTAWAAFAGGLPFQLVPFRGEEAAAPLAPATPDERLADLLRSESPEDLRRLNRIELAVMGVDAELAEAFLSQPWLSPRHQTILVGSLVELEGAEGRRSLVEAALGARAEADALFYQRAAEMLRAYDARVAPIARLSRRGPLVRGTTREGVRVTPLLVDHLIWTRPVAERVRSAAAEDAAGAAPARAEVWLSGTASPRAREQMERLGLVVVERAFERLAERRAAPGAPAEEAGE